MLEPAMFEKSAAFDLFLDEFIDGKLLTLADKNGAYAKLQTEIARQSEVLEGDFSYTEMQRIEGFCGLLDSQAIAENKHLYFEGFNDCMCLLKLLEVY